MVPKKILVVDDDEGIQKTFEVILKSKGYEVDIASTAREGIKKIKKVTYNMVLLDIKLPDKDGTEILKEIRKIRPGMVKIMITGFADIDNAVESLNLGANAYLMKPVSPDDLLKLVAEKLEEQARNELLNEDKVSQWIENRLNKLDEF
ncbi:MAG: response regulator [Ignavibacteria bacterium]|nr:response regulator [Ignavibacteria bacterium]